MSIIDDYLAQVKSGASQNGQMSVLGHPSANQGYPSVAQAYRSPALNAEGSLQNINQLYEPKNEGISSEQKSSYSGTQAVGNYNMGSPSGTAQADNSVGLAKLGFNFRNQAISGVSSLFEGAGAESAGYAGAAALGSGSVANAAGVGTSIAGDASLMAGADLGTETGATLLPLAQTGTGGLSLGAAAVANEAAGATVGTIASGISAGISTAAPYYALAKAGGMAINAITANNPSLQETPFGRLGGSLSEPLGVERYFGQELADHGVGNLKLNNAITTAMNPVGELMSNVDSGNWGGVGDSILNIMSGDVNNIVKSVFGTVVCTELHRQGYISKEVFKADAKFGKQMDKVEYDWYLSWGTPLAKRMKTSKVITKIVSLFMVPVSKYMASEMGVGTGSLFGKMFFKFLQLVCKLRRK